MTKANAEKYLHSLDLGEFTQRLFRYVEKRDKKIEEFRQDKVEAAIFRAASAVGGKDRELARQLADKVCRFLYEQQGERVLHSEEIQDAVEKVLIEEGHARTAKAFILYRERMNLLRRRKALRQRELPATDSKALDATDYALFVRTSDEGIVSWDRNRIIEALIRETNLTPDVAQSVAQEVEEVILTSGVKHITSNLIRELVNSKLVERGLAAHREQHARLGLPLFDVERILKFRNKENSNTPHNPEGTNLTLAESMNKQYALARVFDSDIADAHIHGDIHLHDLGFITRPYCSGQSVEYIKKFGLTLPNSLSNARPARHPETLLAHMVKFSAALQGHFAGAIGWDAVNLYFSPFLVGMSDKDLHQLAQMLVFEYSQQNVARGGQSIFSDINLYWETPKHFLDTPALGPGAVFTGKKYGEYEKEAQRFAWAIFDIYKEGDGSGRPFFFPKPLVHITERFFQTEGHEDFLNHICDVASEKGNTYFVFDRGDTAKIAECCRLKFELEPADLADAATPWKMRYCAMQNVTVNLPRIAYRSHHNTDLLFKNLRAQVRLAVRAHLQKYAFLKELLDMESAGPLALLTMKLDDERYLRIKRATFLVGMLGLNEMIQYHLGKELHEDDEAFKLGLRVVAEMRAECRRLSNQNDNMRFLLEQTPAESTAYRLAKLDMQFYPEQTAEIVKGRIENDSIYYTNSTYLNVGLPIDPIDRVYKEGKFHDMIDAGALTHLWLADARPPKEVIANFVIKTFRHTNNAQIAFSPEFTSCVCGKTSRGLHDTCPYCKSDKVDFITRVTGYFSKVSGWNKGKRAELKDRYKTAFDTNLFSNAQSV